MTYIRTANITLIKTYTINMLPSNFLSWYSSFSSANKANLKYSSGKFILFPSLSERIIALLRVSEYFNNDCITLQIISDVIMPKLNSENSFEYLKYSYEKLKKIKDNKVKSNSLYFDLFYRCLEIIGNNVQVFIKQLDNKV